MTISIINHTDGEVTDEELQKVIRAINRQIKEDFAPYWGISATLRLEGASTKEPETVQLADMRGDAIIYLWNKVDVDDALGYHDRNAHGIPFGFVFTALAKEIGEHWSTTLSHEALELLADPETNMLVMGPHPSKKYDVFHWFEMCDAVQDQTYQVDGVAVSNFVLPLYFTGTRDTDEVGARNDFLGKITNGTTLKSFGINPGGYIGFFDPKKNDHDTFAIKGDRVAAKRLRIKSKAKETRRSVRYRDHEQRERLLEKMTIADGAMKKSAMRAAKEPAVQYDSIKSVMNNAAPPEDNGTPEPVPKKPAKKTTRTGAAKRSRPRRKPVM